LTIGDPLALRETVEPGGIVTLSGLLPRAPRQPGWYVLALDLSGSQAGEIRVATCLQQVVASDLRAEVTPVTFPPVSATYDVPIEALVSLTNRGLTDWKAGDTRLTYQWLSWDNLPIAGGAGASALRRNVPAGEKITVHLSVTPPAGAGVFHCLFGVECGGQPAVLVGNAAMTALPVATTDLNSASFQPIDVSGYFSKNTWASYLTSAAHRDNFDGDGHAFPTEEFLPDADEPVSGYQQGYGSGTPSPASPGFQFGHFQNGHAPVIMAAGQQILLPVRPASALYLVALATRESHSAPFTVRYRDGSEQKSDLQISYWMDDPQFNEPVLLKTRYLHTNTLDNWYFNGRLFVYKIVLDPTRIPTALILPPQTDSPIAVFALTMETTPPYQWDPATGIYHEWTPPTPDLDALARRYTPADWWTVAKQLAAQTYPAGARLLDWEGVRNQQQNCWAKADTRATVPALTANLPRAEQAGFRDYAQELQRETAALVDDDPLTLGRDIDRYALAPTPNLDIVYRLPLFLPNNLTWPARGSINAILPDFMKTNPYYQRLFASAPAPATVNHRGKKHAQDELEPSPMSDLDFFGVMDADNIALHGAMASLPLRVMPEQMRDVASLQLLTALYLRQLQANAPVFAQVCANKQIATVFLLLYDRASYALASAEDAHLADTAFLAPIRAELLKPENQAAITALRKAVAR
jgi:hypothetical protein